MKHLNDFIARKALCLLTRFQLVFHGNLYPRIQRKRCFPSGCKSNCRGSRGVLRVGKLSPAIRRLHKLRFNQTRIRGQKSKSCSQRAETCCARDLIALRSILPSDNIRRSKLSTASLFRSLITRKLPVN